jgi:glutamate synthase (NADPH/NADH) small chain
MARFIHCERSPQERIGDFEESHRRLTPDEAVGEAQRCVSYGCKAPSCETGCPLRTHICQMMRWVAGGRFIEGARVLRKCNNTAEICARVCPHEQLCEGHCVLAARGEAIAIGALERFVTDYALEHAAIPLPPPRMRTGKDVAIIGSGPAGLACAEELAKRGHKVTVYEALPHPGGLLIYAIPGFKVARPVVERRLAYLRALGIEFVCNTRVGQDLTLAELLNGRYQAIFLATGATQPTKTEIDGRNVANVVDALAFISRTIVPSEDMPPGTERPECVQGKRAMVLGGGDTAMGVARALVRMGAEKVTCIYRRDEASMPGSPNMVRWAKEEGVKFRFLTAPVRFITNDSHSLSAIECARMALSDPDDAGRRKLIPVHAGNFVLNADFAVLAFGFSPSRVCGADHDLAVNADGTYVVDANHMTSQRGVFAGGSITRGMGPLVTAVKDGCGAAEAIDRFLAGVSTSC